MERGVRLRIDVDQPDALARAGERGAQVHGGRGFADAALLVDDGDGAHGVVGGQWSVVSGNTRLQSRRTRRRIIGDAADASRRVAACWQC